MDSMKLTIKIIKFIVSAVIIATVAAIVVQRFSNNKLSIAGVRIFTVVTESMVPVYEVGDVLLVKSQDVETLDIGDDIAYQGEVDSYAGKVITHRIIDMTRDLDTKKLVLTTQGIANDDKDPDITESQVYGKVITKLHIMSWLNGIINNTYGMYFLIVIPLAVIVFTEFKGFKEDREKIHQEELEDELEDDYYGESRYNKSKNTKDKHMYNDTYEDDYYDNRQINNQRSNRHQVKYYNEDYFEDRRNYDKNNSKKQQDNYHPNSRIVKNRNVQQEEKIDRQSKRIRERRERRRQKYEE